MFSFRRLHFCAQPQRLLFCAQLQEAAFLCRPFCSWVLCKDSGNLWRCGWKWTLESLVDSPSEYHFQADEAYQSSRVSL